MDPFRGRTSLALPSPSSNGAEVMSRGFRTLSQGRAEAWDGLVQQNPQMNQTQPPDSDQGWALDNEDPPTCLHKSS